MTGCVTQSSQFNSVISASSPATCGCIRDHISHYADTHTCYTAELGLKNALNFLFWHEFPPSQMLMILCQWDCAGQLASWAVFQIQYDAASAHQLWQVRLFTHLKEQNTRRTKEEEAKSIFEVCFRSNRRLELLFRMVILYFSCHLYSWSSDLITRTYQFTSPYQTSSTHASLSSSLLNIYK